MPRTSSPAAPALASSTWLGRYGSVAAAAIAWVLVIACVIVVSGQEVVRIAGLALALPAFAIAWRSGRQQRLLQREEQARWEELLAVDEVVVGLDRTGHITMLSALGQRLLGMSMQEALAQDWIEVAVADDEQELARKGLMQLMASDITAPEFVEFEHAIITGTERRLFRWRATVSVRGGEVVGCMASGIDITVQRQAQQQLMRDQDDLTQLVAIARAVGRESDARQAVVDGIGQLAEAQIASLCEPDEAYDALVVTSSTDPEMIGMRIPLAPDAPSGVAFAFASGKPLFIAEAEGHPLISQQVVAETGLHSLLYEPVYVGGHVVGVLAAGWTASNVKLGGHRTNLVSLAAGEAAVAVERASSLKALQLAALADPLTGVPNRRAFDSHLRTALATARRENASVAIAMMDLNGFKRLNDTEGHEAGDRVLKECASLWTSELRPGDLLARFGGDEFAAILPTCGEASAPAVATRLRGAVRHPAGSGVGIAVWDGIESAEQLLRRADRALYADKAARSQRINDPARLAAVLATGLLQGDEDPELQSLTETLARTLGVPVAVLGLVTDTHEVYAAQTGMQREIAEAGELELHKSYCQYPAATGRELVVGDTTRHEMLQTNFATTDLGLRAYAGVPIKIEQSTVGVLCAASDEPVEWTPEQLGALRLAAEHATRRLELQRARHGGNA